jgi:hypothetical protein
MTLSPRVTRDGVLQRARVARAYGAEERMARAQDDQHLDNRLKSRI